METLNLIGREISKLRNQRGRTRDFPANRLQRGGWIKTTRNDVFRIEGPSVYVADLRLFYFAQLLPVELAALSRVPKTNLKAPIEETMASIDAQRERRFDARPHLLGRNQAVP